MLGQLREPKHAGRVMRELAQGREVLVELTDGPAKVRYADPPPNRQRELPIIDYQARVSLVFELPAQVKCRASSEMEAKHVITEVMLGSLSWPKWGFDCIVDPNDLRAFVESLQMQNPMSVKDVDVVNVFPRLELFDRNAQPRRGRP
jgi:hypothetical protein